MAFNMRHDMMRDSRPTMVGDGGGDTSASSKSNKKSGLFSKSPKDSDTPKVQPASRSRAGAPVAPQRVSAPAHATQTTQHAPYDHDAPYDDMLSDRSIEDHRAHHGDDEFSEQEFEYESEISPYIAKYPENVIAYWQGPEYEVAPKSRRWYVTAGSVIAAIALYSVMTDSHIVAILFLIIGAVGFLYLNTAPRVLDYALTTEGVVVGEDLYYYDQIDSYWIIYEPPHTRVISLHIPGKIFPYIHVPLHQIDPVDMREGLSRFVPEVRQEKTFVDMVERFLHI